MSKDARFVLVILGLTQAQAEMVETVTGAILPPHAQGAILTYSAPKPGGAGLTIRAAKQSAPISPPKATSAAHGAALVAERVAETRRRNKRRRRKTGTPAAA